VHEVTAQDLERRKQRPSCQSFPTCLTHRGLEPHIDEGYRDRHGEHEVHADPAGYHQGRQTAVRQQVYLAACYLQHPDCVEEANLANLIPDEGFRVQCPLELAKDLE